MSPISAATLLGMVGEVGYALRLPKALKVELEQRAKENHRSLNSEMVHRLEQSVEADRREARRQARIGAPPDLTATPGIP